MQHHNKLPQVRKRVQPGVRVDAELWKKIKKLIIDLGIPTTQFVEEALEERAKRGRQELKERRSADLDAPTIPIHEEQRETA